MICIITINVEGRGVLSWIMCFFPDEDTCPQRIEYILDVNFDVDVDDFVVGCRRGEITWPKEGLHNQRRGCVTSGDVVWLEYGLFNVRGGCELQGVVSVTKDTLYKWHIEEIFSFLQTWKQPQVEGINDHMWWPCSTWLPWTPLPLPCLMDCFPKVWRQVGRRVTVLQPVALSSSEVPPLG